MSPTLVIYNPTAGRNRVAAMWPEVNAELTASGIDFHAVQTRLPGEAIDLARAAVGKYQAVIGVGGDGTMSEIVNGLMQASEEGESIPFGIVPLGTGNDFAKVLPPTASIGGHGYDWRAAIQMARRAGSRLYDVGKLSACDPDSHRPRCRYFLNVADVGFGAHVVENLAHVPGFISGYPAYLVAVLKTIINYPALRLRIMLDDLPAIEMMTTMTAIGNGRCFGGGFWVCADALADDGLLDVMIADQVTRWAILSLIPRFQRGTHLGQEAIRMRRARYIVLESDQPFLIDADGELPFQPVRRVQIEVLPRKLRLMI